MSLFRNTQSAIPEKARLNGKLNSSRASLVLVVVFTLINVIFAVTGSDTYFLFSASLPYYLAMIGALLCGKFPDEYYEEGDVFLPDTVLIALAAAAIAIIAVYLLLWLFSKKKAGFLIAAAVLFAIDTIAMIVLFGITAEMLIDILIHAWVLYDLISGCIAYYKLKNLPEEEPAYTVIPDDNAEADNAENGIEEENTDAAPTEEASAEESSAQEEEDNKS